METLLTVGVGVVAGTSGTGGWRPRVLLSPLQGTGRPPAQRVLQPQMSLVPKVRHPGADMHEKTRKNFRDVLLSKHTHTERHIQRVIIDVKEKKQRHNSVCLCGSATAGSRRECL